MSKSENTGTQVSNAPEKKFGFFGRTGMYGFELFMALFGLIVTAVVIDYGLFVLFNYIRGFYDATTFVDEFAIWIVAMMIVWLPVTVIFYLRSRSEEERNTVRLQSQTRKVLASIYFFMLIVGAVGLAFAAVYALIRLAIDPNEKVANVLVRVVVPALLAVAVHVGMLLAYTKSGRPSKKMFAIAMSSVAVVVSVVLLFVSVGQIRASKLDQIVSADLTSIQTSITNYYDDKGKLPERLNQLGLKDEVATRQVNYTFTVVDTTRYTLCATYQRDSNTWNDISRPVPAAYPSFDGEEYKSYGTFYEHTKGNNCFKLRVYAASDNNLLNLQKSLQDSNKPVN